MKMDQLKALLHNKTRSQLLTSISTMEHQSVNQPLNNGTLCLSKFKDLVLSCCMRNKYLGFAALKSDMISKDQIRLKYSLFLISFLITKVFKVFLTSVVLPLAE